MYRLPGYLGASFSCKRPKLEGKEAGRPPHPAKRAERPGRGRTWRRRYLNLWARETISPGGWQRERPQQNQGKEGLGAGGVLPRNEKTGDRSQGQHGLGVTKTKSDQVKHLPKETQPQNSKFKKDKFNKVIQPLSKEV